MTVEFGLNLVIKILIEKAYGFVFCLCNTFFFLFSKHILIHISMQGVLKHTVVLENYMLQDISRILSLFLVFFVIQNATIRQNPTKGSDFRRCNILAVRLDGQD